MSMRSMKDAAGGERLGGMGGGDLEEAMWKRAEICDEKCDQGGFAVSISIMVQPTDHTSADLPCPVCLIPRFELRPLS